MSATGISFAFWRSTGFFSSGRIERMYIDYSVSKDSGEVKKGRGRGGGNKSPTRPLPCDIPIAGVGCERTGGNEQVAAPPWHCPFRIWRTWLGSHVSSAYKDCLWTFGDVLDPLHQCGAMLLPVL